jgi:hypothetical protein
MQATITRTSSGSAHGEAHEGFAVQHGHATRETEMTADTASTGWFERVRTFVDRTLDVALGRFDH